MRNGGAGDEEEASVTWQQMEEAGLCLVYYPHVTRCHTLSLNVMNMALSTQ